MIIKPKNFALYYLEIKKRIQDKFENYDHPSVINIFLDTTLKYRFYRLLPKTIKVLTILKNDANSLHKVVESERFHSVLDWTEANFMGHSHGVSHKQCYQVTNLNRIDTYAKQLGILQGITSQCVRLLTYLISKKVEGKYA